MYSLVVRCIFNAPQKPFMGNPQKLSSIISNDTMEIHGNEKVYDSFRVFIYNIIIINLQEKTIFTSLPMSFCSYYHFNNDKPRALIVVKCQNERFVHTIMPLLHVCIQLK